MWSETYSVCLRREAGEALLEVFTRKREILEADASCFSTDAGQPCADRHIKSPQRPAVRSPAWLVDGETKTQQHFSSPIGLPGSECHVSEEVFSTAICRCYRYVIRGADDRAVCSNGTRCRQTYDAALGPLGARSQQGQYRTRQ